MAQRFLTSIDLSKNELQNAVIQNLATAPSSPIKGQIYFNTGDNKLYIYDGTAWEPLDGDIQSVTAGNGLLGGGSSGDVTLTVLGGNGISVDPTNGVSANITSGLEFSSGAIQVKVDNSSIEFDGNAAISLKASGVTSGSYGSATSIPTFTVDEDGRLTAAGTASISTDLDIAGDVGTDTVSLATEALTFIGGDGITTTVGTNAVSIDVDSTVVRTSGDQTIGGNKTFSNNVIISGDLTVSGSTTTVNTETILLADNIITLNSNFTSGAPTEDAGIEVLRGTELTMSLFWDESAGDWYATDLLGAPKRIINEGTLADSATANGYTATISGNGSLNSFLIAFPASFGVSFSPNDVMVQLVDLTTSETVFADVTRSASGITVTFASSPLSGQDYKVLMTKLG